MSFNVASNRGKFVIIPARNEFEEAESKIEVHPFFEQLVDFVHYQDYLLALDISSMGFDYWSTRYFVENGLKESRTLTSCFLRGLGLDEDEEDYLARIVNPRMGHFMQNLLHIRVIKEKAVELFRKNQQIKASMAQFFQDVLKNA